MCGEKEMHLVKGWQCRDESAALNLALEQTGAPTSLGIWQAPLMCRRTGEPFLK